MDSCFYYLSCKGEKKGPYKFYQLQQLRLDGMVAPGDFFPHEWEEFNRFLDSRGSGDTTFIRRLDETKPQVVHHRPVLRWLTYAGYACGLLFVAAGLVHGTRDYLLRSGPMFCLGLLFAIALCYTTVNRLTHNRISAKTSKRFPLVWLICGLLPLLSAITMTAAVAHFFFAGADHREMILTGMKYLGVAAALCFYRPFYLQTIATNAELPPLKPHSAWWIASLAAVPALAGLYFLNQQFSHPTLTAVADHVFARPVTSADSIHLKWEFTVRPGDSIQHAVKTLGNPQEVIGRHYIYRGLGVQLFFDPEKRIYKLQFAGDPECALHKTPILGGITPAMDLDRIKAVLRITPTTVSTENATETYLWNLPPYQITGCFWTRDIERDGKLCKRDSQKWLEIAANN